MNNHRQPLPAGTIASPNVTGPDTGRFELTFIRHGARTAIDRQFVSYPFHLTRPFALDAAIPSLLSIYQQSASGGLYRADRLACHYHVGRQAATHVSTQSATIVHDCQGQAAHHDVEIMLEEGAFFALTPDPLVLFPGAACANRLEAKLAPGAVLLLCDAFTMHDPKDASRPFDRLASDNVIRDTEGRLLARDSFHVAGEDFLGPASPMGHWRVVSSFLLLGDLSRLPSTGDLAALLSLDDRRVVVGVTALPNGAGWGVRCLARDFVAARAVAELLFSASVFAAFGSAPSRRRK